MGHPTGNIYFLKLYIFDVCVRAQGQVVYANYGRREDLQELQKQNVELKNKVVLLRAGRLSFAEQVCLCFTKQKGEIRKSTTCCGHLFIG